MFLAKTFEISPTIYIQSAEIRKDKDRTDFLKNINIVRYEQPDPHMQSLS